MQNPNNDRSVDTDLDETNPDNYDQIPSSTMTITATCDCFHCTGIEAPTHPSDDWAL